MGVALDVLASRAGFASERSVVLDACGPAVFFPFPRRDPDGIRFLTEMVESGEFVPVVDRSYPLTQITEAHRYVETGPKVGNVVIDVDRARAVD